MSGTESAFKATLEMLVPQLTQALMKTRSLDEDTAIKQLYTSVLYQKLEQEDTKLWHLSVPTLLELLAEEEATGTLTFPEEA